MNQLANQQDALRKLNDLCLAAFRKKKSEQTGLIHLFYHSKDEQVDVAVPLEENFLYAWALLRSKTAENIVEAKTLLERLRHFASGGNFPVYMHDFPVCKDRYSGIQILAILQTLLPHFGTVLGQELRDHLTQICKNLCTHALKVQQEHPTPFTIALRLACAAKLQGASGADALLEMLRMRDDRAAWTNPADIGEMLTALYSIYPSLHHSPWRAFWDHVNATWHRPTCAYAGPALKEFQVGFEPEATLYDLYLGMLSGTFSARALGPGVHLFKAPWVHPTEDVLREIETPSYAYALATRKDNWNPATDRSFHPLKLLWGNSERVHSFVCQGGNCKSSTWSAHESQLEITFDMAEPPSGEDREKARELSFYLDFAEQHAWTFAGQRSTTFKIEDEILMESAELNFNLRFEVLEGEGQWMGHLMRGNRPAQIATKGSARYNSYDWQLFLRTVRRSSQCRIKAILTLLS